MDMNLFITGHGYSLPTETKIEIMMALSVTAIALLALLPCIIYVNAKKLYSVRAFSRKAN